MSAGATLRVQVLLAIRSLRAHWVKTLIVGGILFGGTFLLVFGGTLFASIRIAMQESVTGSIVGHLQIFSEEAKDSVTFYGPQASSSQDIGVIKDFARVKKEIESIPHVRAVVPMGRDVATVIAGNEIERLTEGLREAVHAGNAANVELYARQVRQAIDQLAEEYERRKGVMADPASLADGLASIDRARSEEFWREFSDAPLEGLEFLDGKVAPLEGDARPIFLAYIGTDLQAFSRSFPGFEMASGQMIPQGQRGLLVNDEAYEKYVKNRVAVALDKVHDALNDENDPKTIAGDTVLQEDIKRNVRQYRRVIYALNPGRAPEVEAGLRAYLRSQDDLPQLLEQFLQVDDANFAERYRYFYESIAPHMRLYDVPIGDSITIRTFTRSGYSRAENVKVWGTYRFKGLEGSQVASAYSILDLMTFRDLYGLMTPERKAEIDRIRESVGVKAVERESAEAELFGADSPVQEEATPPQGFDVPDIRVEREDAATVRPFSQEDIDSGVVLNAAVVLDDPGKIEEVRRAIEAKGLGLKVIDWQAAAGILGQMIIAIGAVLFVAIVVIFVVALVIINNALLIATMDRVQEIGTLRAIGAQRSFVLTSVILETVVLAAISAAAGTLAARGATAWANVSGIPSGGQDFLVLLFGGQRLFPTFDVPSTIFGLVVIFLIALVSSVYPARIATRTQPVVAMQRHE